MHYFMKCIQDGQEILGRDLEPFIKACEATFPELHLQFSVHRDLPEEAIARRLRDLSPRGVLGASEMEGARKDLDSTRRAIDEQRQAAESCERAVRHVSGSGLAQSYLRARPGRMRQKAKELEAEARSLEGSISTTLKYIKAYRKDGRGAAAVFCAASNLHVVRDSQGFLKALKAVVKEVTDADKFIVRAKLGGGLRVFVEVLRHPALAYAVEFAGGLPNLRQLSAAGPEFKPVLDAAVETTMVTPCRDVVVDGATKDERKSLGPRFLKSVVRRLDQTSAAPTAPQPGPLVMPAFLGKHVGTEERFHFGLENLGHFAIVGPTGCGKTFTARVLVEEAARNGIAVIVIDPRDQWAGMALPEDRKAILGRYGDFGMEPGQATGYPIAYYAPGDSVGLALPKDLSHLAKAQGISVVSVQSLDDRKAGVLFRDILQAAFDVCCARGESEVPCLWFLVEEFHAFLPQKVADMAKAEAGRAVALFDTLRREGRKFGLFTGFIATSFRDAGGALASVSRLNTNTLIAFRTHDRDLQYISSFIDPKRIGQLGQHEAFLCSPQGNHRFVTRPPYSKVSHLPDGVRTTLFGRHAPSCGDLTEDELMVLNAVREHHATTGEYPNVAGVMRAAGLRGKGKLESLIRTLEEKGHVKTQKLTGRRGSPRIVIPVTRTGDRATTRPDEMDETPDAMRTQR